VGARKLWVFARRARQGSALAKEGPRVYSGHENSELSLLAATDRSSYAGLALATIGLCRNPASAFAVRFRLAFWRIFRFW